MIHTEVLYTPWIMAMKSYKIRLFSDAQSISCDTVCICEELRLTKGTVRRFSPHRKIDILYNPHIFKMEVQK